MLSAVSGSSSIRRTRIRPLPSLFTSLTNITNKARVLSRTEGREDQNCHKLSHTEIWWICRPPGDAFRNPSGLPPEGSLGLPNIFSLKFNKMALRSWASPDLPAARKFIYSARLWSPHESRPESNETSSAARLPPDRERAFHESNA